MTVQSFNANAYHERDLNLLKTLTSYAAIAIDNGRAHAELLAAYNTMEEVSVTDQLTGLKNRRYLTFYFSEDINQSLRGYDDWLKLGNEDPPNDSDKLFFILDLDHFKRVNDTYGHAAGDAVLVQIKMILSKVFRDSDFLVRWGGEEFLVIARFTNRRSASQQAERVRVAIEQHEFDIGDEQTIKMTSSIGYAAFPFIGKKPRALTWEQVVNIADHCLYIAKTSQRNAWVGVSAQEEIDSKAFVKMMKEEPANLLSCQHLKVETSISSEKVASWQ